MARTIDRLPPAGGGPHDPGLEARVAKLEAAVEHIQRDIADIKAVLARLAPIVDRMDGFLQATLPILATKAEMAVLRAEMARRPTTATLVAVLAVVVGIIGLPYWGQWLAATRALLGP